MYNFWELEDRRGDLDGMMCRLKDLSAYRLTHAAMMEWREGVEFLALATFLSGTSKPQFHNNQERLKSPSEETLACPGQSEIVEREVAMRKARATGRIKAAIETQRNCGCSRRNRRAYCTFMPRDGYERCIEDYDFSDDARNRRYRRCPCDGDDED
jgi:hypothetical protein